MSQKFALLTLSILATAALTANRAVGIDGGVAGAGLNSWGCGVADTASGAYAPVDAIGSSIGCAGAAIAAGALVEVGTAGKYITKASGIAVGRAFEAASGDGVLFEVMLFQN